jgi:PIN domain nuclease of toxin-antitoxin system
MPDNERCLLDTHVWVWLLNGDSHLENDSVLSCITRATRKSGLFLSAISIWEVAMLEARGRIAFSTGITSWIHDALSVPGVQVIPLLPEIAIDSTRLPGQFHGDPADRIIVATSRMLKCPLITADTKIQTYAGEGHCEVIKL